MAKRINIISGILAVLIFVIPFLFFPTRGGLDIDSTVYTYGFPFPWFYIFFEAHSGRLIFFQAVSSNFQSFDIKFLTAILDLIILFIAIRALITVFGRTRENYVKKKKQHEKEYSQQDQQNDSEESSDSSDPS